MVSDNNTSGLPSGRRHHDTDTKSLATVLETALAEADPSRDQHWATFAASYLGFCPRQTYLVHLGLRDNTGRRGRFRARRLIQDYLKRKLQETHPHLEFTPSMAVDAGRARIVGRPTAYDPTNDVVYHVKPRNGWYKFHPPMEGHLNQLHLYMRGLDAEKGQLVYVSMSNLADIRVWPASYKKCEYVEYDAERALRLTDKADAIRDEIVTNGIATATTEIPFDPCGCYLCETEEIDLPADVDGQTQFESNLTTETSKSTTTTTTASERDTIDLDAEPLDVTPDESAVLSSETSHVPADLQSERVWVVWDGEQKIARAPWETGHMYPCEWAAEKDVDPRRPYAKAQMVAELPVKQVHEAWPFPDGDDLPEEVWPAVLLPHETDESPLTFVDFDDVRDPISGTAPREVREILDALGGYAEVSRSGSGVHCWVRGGLPDGISTFSAPLRESGHIEIYDQSRFTGGTWRHIAETPTDRVPEASTAIRRVIATYSNNGT